MFWLYTTIQSWCTIRTKCAIVKSTVAWPLIRLWTMSMFRANDNFSPPLNLKSSKLYGNLILGCRHIHKSDQICLFLSKSYPKHLIFTIINYIKKHKEILLSFFSLQTMPFIYVMLTKGYMGGDGSFEKAMSEISLWVSFLLLNLEIASNVSNFIWFLTHPVIIKHISFLSKWVFSKGAKA